LMNRKLLDIKISSLLLNFSDLNLQYHSPDFRRVHYRSKTGHRIDTSLAGDGESAMRGPVIDDPSRLFYGVKRTNGGSCF
ncbi:MAG: hypothetical protein KJ927_00715, partial [Candidatus Eisenbacteria bacterium]|nr:hypothetical protein [Candidatus Eisenbacteria bacterium]